MWLADIPNIIGLIGVVLVLLAYYLLQIGKFRAETYLFSLVNLMGSIFILYSLFYHWNLASVVIEIAWIIISITGLFRVWRSRHS